MREVSKIGITQAQINRAATNARNILRFTFIVQVERWRDGPGQDRHIRQANTHRCSIAVIRKAHQHTQTLSRSWYYATRDLCYNAILAITGICFDPTFAGRRQAVRISNIRFGPAVGPNALSVGWRGIVTTVRREGTRSRVEARYLVSDSNHDSKSPNLDCFVW